MTNFEKITETPETLATFLTSIPIAGGPWDVEFHREFCDSCERENCDEGKCPNQDKRCNPLWWLLMGEGKAAPAIAAREKQEGAGNNG